MSHQTGARRTGRPPLTSQGALLAAARQIGFAGLTVGAVTAAAGVKYSTFYRHYPSVDALVAALVEDVFQREFTPSDLDEPWQDTLRDTAAAVSELLGRHPGMAAAIVSLPRVPDSVLAVYRHLSDALLRAGFDGERAAFGAMLVLDTLAITELTSPGAGCTLADRQRAGEAVEPAIDPQVLAVTAGLLDQPTRTWAAGKIALRIRGLETELVGAR